MKKQKLIILALGLSGPTILGCGTGSSGPSDPVIPDSSSNPEIEYKELSYNGNATSKLGGTLNVQTDMAVIPGPINDGQSTGTYNHANGAIEIKAQDGTVILKDLDGPDSQGFFEDTVNQTKGEIITSDYGFTNSYDSVEMVNITSTSNLPYGKGWQGFMGVVTDPKDFGAAQFTYTGEAVNWAGDTANVQLDYRPVGEVDFMMNGFSNQATSNMGIIKITGVPVNGNHFEATGINSTDIVIDSSGNAVLGDLSSGTSHLSGDFYGYELGLNGYEGPDEAAGVYTFMGADGAGQYYFMAD